MAAWVHPVGTHPRLQPFTRVRTRIGPTWLSQLFAGKREQLKAAGLMSEVFTFVDATHLIAPTGSAYRGGVPRGPVARSFGPSSVHRRPPTAFFQQAHPYICPPPPRLSVLPVGALVFRRCQCVAVSHHIATLSHDSGVGGAR
jgi:hypothetical protein